jgi:hypothetical protein
MRTTITLDADVEALVKKQMRKRGITFKQAVNDAIRAALAPKERRAVSFPTYHMGPMNIPGHKALQLAGELDDQHIIETMLAADERGRKRRVRRRPRAG